MYFHRRGNHSVAIFKKNTKHAILHGFRSIKHFLKAPKKWRAIFVFFLSLFFIFSGFVALWLASLKMPDLNTYTPTLSQSTKIYDKTGKVLLYNVNQDTKRTVVPLSEISEYIQKATIAIEDKNFYKHNGVQIKSFIRATFVNLFSGQFSQGGSTITQQVIKNSLLTKEKKVSRKIKEWVLALKLEKAFDKATILALYLNGNPYGGSLYGVEEASSAFFGKSAKDVNLAEAAYLAAIPKAPTYYSPYGKNKEALNTRKNLVLAEMKKENLITEKQYEDAKNTKVAFLDQETKSIKAPHFVEMVKSYLIDKYGEEKVRNGGLKVTTTLDYDLQEKAEAIVKKAALENGEKFNAHNASMVAIDTQTGGVSVLVGSRDYFDKEIEGNFNIATAHRQPGSAFKPFVYAAGFLKGYTPDTVLFDLETEFSTQCSPDGTPLYSGAVCYKPQNYDGRFRGPMTVRSALAQSINVPAVKMLYLVGVKNAIRLAKDMGIQELKNPDQYGLTLVLGGGEVSLLDMTSAYSVFATEGIRNPYNLILKVEDSSKNILEEYRPNGLQVLNEEVTRQISSILSDNNARAPIFGANSSLYFPNNDVAVKTGTTNNYRDAWILGYTPKIAVGAWTGNNDNSPIDKKVAGFIVAPMWHEFMQYVLQKENNGSFVAPSPTNNTLKPVLRGIWQGGKTFFIEKTTGKLATEFTPESMKSEQIIPEVHSILYWVDKNDPQGAQPSYPETDPQFAPWEYAVRKWVLDTKIIEGGVSVPTETDPIHTQANVPVISINIPSNAFVYDKNTPISVRTSYIGTFPLSKIEYYINGVYIDSASIQNSFSFIPSNIPNISDTNTLSVVVYDTVLNKGEATVEFKVLP